MIVHKHPAHGIEAKDRVAEPLKLLPLAAAASVVQEAIAWLQRQAAHTHGLGIRARMGQRCRETHEGNRRGRYSKERADVGLGEAYKVLQTPEEPLEHLERIVVRRAHRQQLHVARSVADGKLCLLGAERAICLHDALRRCRTAANSPAANVARDDHAVAVALCGHIQQQVVVEVPLSRVSRECAEIDPSCRELVVDDRGIRPHQAAVLRIGERRPLTRRKELSRVFH